MKKRPFITLTSDFGVQSQGVGIMEGVAMQINPEAYIIHLMHGLPSFNLFYAARTMETTTYLPVGCHVCVVDPGVGTKRKPIHTEQYMYIAWLDMYVLLLEHWLQKEEIGFTNGNTIYRPWEADTERKSANS